MRDIDKLIDEALDAEQRTLLRSIGEEPGFIPQAIAIFDGQNGWVHLIMMLAQSALFVAGIWAGWNFFQADSELAALHWGLPSAVMLLMALIIKIGMWPSIQTNRLLREMKRIELQIASAGKA